MSNFVGEWPQLRKWAVVGASNDREKFGNKIYRDLKNAGYEAYAVNPKASEVEGDPCYPSVKDIPVKVDVVNMVVPPGAAERVIQDCKEAGLTRIWFQPGSESEDAIQKAKDAGLEVVHDACIMIVKQAWS